MLVGYGSSVVYANISSEIVYTSKVFLNISHYNYYVFQQNMTALVADFGLARAFHSDESTDSPVTARTKRRLV